MTSIFNRISNVPKTLWEHKKKTAFASFLLYLGGQYAVKANTNRKIRARYAQLAVQFGEQTISAEDKPRRVTVLANVAANERSCYDDFTKNVLPLFHLAGIQVELIKSESAEQLESLAAAVDKEDQDAVYVVGGDGTIGHVITGIFRNRDQALLPIGFFPGGYDNMTLRRLVPSVFINTEDVRRYCESAMALIEDVRKPIFAFKFQKEGAEDKPFFGIGDVGAGWFRHIEDKRKKLWYFGNLKRRWAYIWEMIKRSPEDMELAVKYEEYCPGCRNCKVPPIVAKAEWRWWHILTGTPKVQPKTIEKDYSKIENENCGRIYETMVKGSDLLVENEQNETSQIRLRMGGSNSRFGVIKEGMNRCSSNAIGKSEDPQFYSADLIGNLFNLKFIEIPDIISKVYFSSNAMEINKGDVITVARTNHILQVFLPSSLRFDINSL